MYLHVSYSHCRCLFASWRHPQLQPQWLHSWQIKSTTERSQDITRKLRAHQCFLFLLQPSFNVEYCRKPLQLPLTLKNEPSFSPFSKYPTQVCVLLHPWKVSPYAEFKEKVFLETARLDRRESNERAGEHVSSLRSVRLPEDIGQGDAKTFYELVIKG